MQSPVTDIFRRLILASALVMVELSPTPLLSSAQSQETATDPPEITIGERLFLETRFAQFFAHFLSGGAGVNDSLPTGDPVMDHTVTVGEPLPGPFAGLSMNCRACHLVDEHVETPGGTMRTYADFARRSPVPARTDGAITAPRNSPALVNATLPRSGGLLLHFDAEFATTADLVMATFTGRNFGWLPGEQAQAIAHLARIIREDNGTGGLAQDFGGLPYSIVLQGTDPTIPDEFRLPEAFRLKVATASDAEIFHAVAALAEIFCRLAPDLRSPVNNLLSFSEWGRALPTPWAGRLPSSGGPRPPVLVKEVTHQGDHQWD